RNARSASSFASGLGGVAAVAGGIRHREGRATRRDLLPRSDTLLAAQDHPVVRLEPLANDTQTAVERPEFDNAPLRDVVVADDVDEAVGLVGADCLVGQ